MFKPKLFTVFLLISFLHHFTTTQPKNKTLYIHGCLKTVSLCTKTTIKSVSAPLHALGEGKGLKRKAEGEEEVEEKEEEEAARRKGGAGDEGKVALRFGIVAVAGKS